MLPLDYATDREMLDAALPTIGLAEPPDAKLAVDSQHARTCAKWNARPRISTKPAARPTWRSSATPRPLPFDAAGNLPLRRRACGAAAAMRTRA